MGGFYLKLESSWVNIVKMRSARNLILWMKKIKTQMSWIGKYGFESLFLNQMVSQLL